MKMIMVLTFISLSFLVFSKISNNSEAYDRSPKKVITTFFVFMLVRVLFVLSALFIYFRGIIVDFETTSNLMSYVFIPLLYLSLAYEAFVYRRISNDEFNRKNIFEKSLTYIIYIVDKINKNDENK
jgi:hypothetical protein